MWRKRPKAQRPQRTHLAFEQLESRRVLAPVPVLTSLAYITAPQTFQDGALSGIIKVELKDQFGNPFNATGNVAVALSSTSANGMFDSYPANTLITSVTIAKGANTASFRYTDTVVGTPTITAKDGALTAMQQETVTAGPPSKVVFPTPNSAATAIAGDSIRSPSNWRIRPAIRRSLPPPATLSRSLDYRADQLGPSAPQR